MRELLTDQQTADALAVSTGTLANWRCSRLEGPPFIKLGRLVRYRKSDLEEWLTARTVSPKIPALAGAA